MGGGDNPLPDIPSCSSVPPNSLVSFDYNMEIENPLEQVLPRGGGQDEEGPDPFLYLTGDVPLAFKGIDERGDHQAFVYESPNGSKYWVPEVKPAFKPKVGMMFNSWVECEQMFHEYAEQCGFTARLNGHKKWKDVITHKVMVCSKQGKPKSKPIDTLDPSTFVRAQSSTFRGTECTCLIRYKLMKGDYKVLLYAFSDKHNHPMVPSYNMDLTKKGKNLNFDDYEFVHTMSLNKVGPVVSHRFQSSLKGGHHNMHGTKNTFKNVSRDIRVYIGDRDIALVAQKLKDRAETLPNFAYELYHEGGELKCIFWADEISQTSYNTFGDVIAFDATYSTNKYNMIFVPFTGVDNHQKCVTFGAGLIYAETTFAYEWLLRAFFKVHKREPSLILTDQDPSMKAAILKVCSVAQHRLCMWHIMKKLPVKVSGDLLENTDFRKRLHKLVWNVYIRPEVFEERWEKLIVDFNLTTNNWLREMFAQRDMWIPAYFRDVPMCCLMKTTSRCESSNAAFKVNSTHSNTLVQFFMCFDTAMDHQRYNQRICEFRSNNEQPVIQTGEDIEIHASKIYTLTVFSEVQKEIKRGKFLCYITNVDAVDGDTFYDVSHMNHLSEYVNSFKVRVDGKDESYHCPCMGFTRTGLLCRHVLAVFRINAVKDIPGRYIKNRWRRQILPDRIYDIPSRISVQNTELSTLRAEVFECVSVCVDRLCDNLDGLKLFIDSIKEIQSGVLSNYSPKLSSVKKSVILEELIGKVEDCSVAELTPPQGIRNKGCGTNKRLIGPGEKAVEQSKKAPRLCRACNQMGYHDSRNCKNNPEASTSK